MSKPWTPPRHTAKFKPSRIRRAPVQLVPDVPGKARKPVRLSDREQMWFGVTGVVLMAAAVAAVVMGIAIFTFTRDDPDAAARADRFAQCYDAYGSNCVLDGDTITVAGQKMQIAGITAPAIQGAQCDDERTRGIDAAVRLADLLNSGQVTVSRPFRDEYGRVVQSVQVKGEDVGQRLMDAGIARKYEGTKPNWCTSAG